MKTPEEIKKCLEYCHSARPCVDCKYDGRDFPHCVRRLLCDAIEGCNLLEQRLAQVERERDAAIRDCSMPPCATCLYKEKPAVCYICHGLKGGGRVNYEWRGVCEENTHDQP